MQETAIRASKQFPWKAALLGLTLITSAIHFLDNAFRPDLYPGPVWLTRDLILSAWIILLLAACMTYRKDTRTAFVLYGVLGFGGFAHYFMPHANPMPIRCTVTISAEALASALVIGYALLRARIPFNRYPATDKMVSRADPHVYK